MDLEEHARRSIARVLRLATISKPLNYFVLYSAEESPALLPDRVSSLRADLAPALSGLLLALQLPRHRQDSADASNQHLVEARKLEQRPRFHVLPIERFDQSTVAALAGADPTLALGPSDLKPRLEELCESMGFLLPPIFYGAQSSELLRQAWDGIATAMAPAEPRRASHHVMAEFESAATDVPNGFLRYQLTDAVVELEARTPRERVEESLHLRTLISAMADLEERGETVESAGRALPKQYRLQQRQTRVPVAWGVPGVSPSEVGSIARRLGVSRLSLQGLDRRQQSELEAVTLLVASAATRRTGIGITSDGMPGRAFEALSNLERHWASGAQPYKVRRLMSKVNEAASSIWTDDVRLALSRATDLTVFSNFPLGLLTFPGDSAPLVYRLPVTHRPLSSLTAALEYEFANSPRADLTRGFRVLVAECIPPGDSVGALSRIGWDTAEQMLHESEADVELVRVDVSSTRQLDEAIDSHSPDVLVISAHGTEKGGVAGLDIAGQFYAASSRRQWPSLVILSACRVAPRAAGGPNIADRILEQGAVAVLATEVDVDVRHNSLLCVRLFLYMSLAIEGKEPEGDLLTVWHRVQGSSPIADIMHAKGPLGRWMSGGGRQPPPFVRFMNESGRGRLRRTHVFEDTERFLIELAAEEGSEASVRQWLANPSYLPESAFYSMAGFPENVIFKHRPVLSVFPGDLPKNPSRQTRQS